MNIEGKGKIIALGTAATSYADLYLKNYPVECFEDVTQDNILKLKNIFRHLTDDNLLKILLVFLGGKTTLNFIKAISKFDFPRLDEFIFPIYTKPFSWEGGKRKRIAEISEDLIREKFPSHIGISYGIFNPRKENEGVFSYYNEFIYSLIKQIHANNKDFQKDFIDILN